MLSKLRAAARRMDQFILPMKQRAGRGRGDHAWDSAAGEGLYASMLLRAPIPAARLPLMPLAAGLAAAKAIRAVTGLAVDLALAKGSNAWILPGPAQSWWHFGGVEDFRRLW